MKRNCDMVRDLMPLCIDGAASEESQQVVAEHVAECKSCQQIYQDMQGSLPAGQDHGAEAVFSEQMTQRIRKKQRKRLWRNILIGVLVGALLMSGIYFFAVKDATRPMPLDQYEISAYLRADGERMVVIQNVEGICSGWGASGAPINQRADMDHYVYNYYASEPVIPVGEKKQKSMIVDTNNSTKWCWEIRKGDAQHYQTVWKQGENLPACSPELEAYCNYMDELSRNYYLITDEDGNVVNSFWDYSVGEDQSERKPIIVTEEEWHAMQAKISELYDAIPELKFK